VTAHGRFLQLQGAEDQVIAALERGDLSAAPLADAERVLLEWVALLTRESHRNTEDDVQSLRNAGWTDEQIAEAAYITALFAFFNRVADAFGLEEWRP
jgi:alkylhydroperoxidase family enzyme